MLPVVICEQNADLRNKWLGLLTDVLRSEYPALRIESMLGAEKELLRMVEFEAGIMLVVLAADARVDTVCELYASVMARNRDNYVLLCVHDVTGLNAVLSRCLRPAGILVDPFHDEQMRQSMQRIIADYVSQYAPQESETAITVLSGKTMHRIRCRDITYLEARDKLVNICTNRRIVVVRGSLATLESGLGEGFVRCHRAFIVNRECIDSLDCKEMLLTLKDGERLPVSRSCRDSLKKLLQGSESDD